MSAPLTRRGVLTAATALGAALGAGWPRASRADDKIVRIGFQKYGTLVLLKGKGLLDDILKPLGFSVAWTEFAAGPQLLEALNVGAIDFGTTAKRRRSSPRPPAHPCSMSATNRRRPGAKRSSCPRTAP